MPTKKVVKKAVKKVVKPKAFKLEVTLNDKVYKCETDDIKTALMELKPNVIKTRLKFKVSNANSQVDRIMMVRMARLLFNNSLAMDSFVKRITAALK